MPFLKPDGELAIVQGKIPVANSVFLVKEFVPACGWKNFEDSVRHFHFESTPTQALIPNFSYHPVLNGSGYDIELATKKSYRYLHYWIPQVYHDSTNEKILEFMTILKRQPGRSYMTETMNEHSVLLFWHFIISI